MQEKILSGEIVCESIACQKENGWLGNDYHGSNRNVGQAKRISKLFISKPEEKIVKSSKNYGKRECLLFGVSKY